MKKFAFGADRVWDVARLALVLATAGSFAGGWHQLFELMANFRVQLALASVALLIVAVLRRGTTAASIAAALTVANFAPLLPYILPPPLTQTPPSAAPRLRILAVNLQNWSTRSPEITRMADAARADIIVFTEIAAVHREAFARLLETHPFQLPQARRDGSAFDVRLFSRWPVDGSELHLPEGVDFPILEARICEPVWPRCLRLLALHAPRPGLGGRRERQLAFVAERARAAGEDRVLVVGDLNVTPFSPLFAALLDAGGLRDSMIGQGLQPSWLSRFLPLGLTLDHVLVGAGIEVIQRKRGREFGSDHSPVIVDIIVR